MLPVGEGWAFETLWFVSEVTHSQVEMGMDRYGLCDWISSYLSWFYEYFVYFGLID